LSIKKHYLKTRPVCKVTFRLSAEEALDAHSIFLVGEFNDWNKTQTPMKPLKNGGFVVTLDLETGREYQFRYFFDRIIWKNDSDADQYVHSPYGDCDNSVVRV
jgi:1,4-alpha-glucan branching enzyme